MIVSEFIRQRRKQLEITQRGFAEVVGVDWVQFSKIENNRIVPDVETLNRIMGGLFSPSTLKTLRDTAENPYAVLSQRANGEAIEELLPTGLIEYNGAHDWYEVSEYGFEMARKAGWDVGWWYGLQWVRMVA